MKYRTESALVRACCELLSLRAWRWIRHTPVRLHTDRRTGKLIAARGLACQRGAPDIIGLGPQCQLLLIECKRDEGRVSPEQREWAQWCLAAGHHYVVVRSVDDLQEAMAFRTEANP